MNARDPFLAIDRAHERPGEADDAFDAAVVEAARRHAAAIRTNILTGHQQTLHDIATDLGDGLADTGVMEQLVRAAFAVGPRTAGQLLLDLIQKCIDTDAENEALKEVERATVSA